ncbi:hypothetical protein [Stackebrandtia soli]|uniref:hypothetical protein n=1 Tax=Stackebrandtia soli TaxID=1892856 RepID=UPI0039E7D496
MTESLGLTPRARRTTAVLLLTVAFVFVAVAVSALFVGSGTDPRESIGSRAAGFGFSDWASPMVYSPVPLVSPLLAVALLPTAGTRLVAGGVYGALLVVQATVAVSALLFGLDVGAEQSLAAGVRFIDERAAVERFAVDVAMMALTCAGIVLTRTLTRRPKAA